MNVPFGRPSIDVSGAYYGSLCADGIYDDMATPMGGKRPRDGYDELLSDTLGAFATEAKKKRADASYNEGTLSSLAAVHLPFL